jgi:GrpB-like predicted nucleotidyltransferase (UPF0157 family)
MMDPVTEWPAWATERVCVAPADEHWPQQGAQEARRLDIVLTRWLVAPVEHVGSTAVPGLPAKPILDLQAAVADLDCAPLIGEVLGVEWLSVPSDLDNRPGRRFFVKVVNGHRAAHLHVMTLASPRWQEQLVFRDALRADPELVGRYAELKQTLSDRYADDREAYSAAKTEFIRDVRDGR